MESEGLETGLAASRAETDGLFRLLADEDLLVRPLPQRHRLIFYLGHLEAFDWNQVGRMGAGEDHIDKSLDELFARGIDPEHGQMPSDQPADWPTVAQTRDYVRRIRQRLDRVWGASSILTRHTAIEHRWMHAETLAYQLHNLPFEMKRRPGLTETISGGAPVENRLQMIPQGIATLGRKAGAQFGWDNEFDEVTVRVPAFSVSRFKVTNGEYLDFVNEGHDAPQFWTRANDQWFYRGMFGMVPLPLDAPVYVTQIEAAEYARWRGRELMTEAQFHRAAYGTPAGEEREYPWGEMSGVHGNYDSRHWDPVPVTDYPDGASAFGVAQLVGNGWEWTQTPFGPFPGFRPFPNYPGYSADFFDSQHFVLKGASPRTASVLTRRSLRNWFRPDYPYVYATFRLVENE